MRLKVFFVLMILVLVGLTSTKYICIQSDIHSEGKEESRIFDEIEGLTFPNMIFAGYVGGNVTNPSVKVGQLQDAAYKYTETDVVVYEYGVEIDEHVTIVVLDDGLTEEEWLALEQNPEANVDVVGVVTKDSNGTIQYITSPNNSLLDDMEEHEHGFAVISMIAAIARECEVILIDILRGDDTIGFRYNDSDIWSWINNNQVSKDIDIVSYSAYVKDDYTQGTNISQTWDSLLEKDVILLNAAGNFFSYNNTAINTAFPFNSYHTQWYSVGSIDHETRAFKSTKDGVSWFSSWYESYIEGNHIVNWFSLEMVFLF